MTTKSTSWIHRHILIISTAVCILIPISGIHAEAACNKGCPQSDNGPLQYTPGNVYEYNFDSILSVGLRSLTTSDIDDISLRVQGMGKIFAEGNCGYTLQLSGVKVVATKESIEKKIAHNIHRPVHFVMVNGRVEPILCADTDDNIYALNIKRAIISLLQSNTDAESTEVDVFGQCPTQTTVSKMGNAEVVTKVRNLNNCAYREKISSGIINGVVNDKSGVKSTNLLQADYSKETKQEHGVIDSAHLFEEYTFSDSHNSGFASVRAKVITTLKLKNTAGVAAAPPATSKHGVSIIFQKPDTYSAKNIGALKKAISDIVQLIENYVQKDSGKNFVELIRLMRNADSDTLLELAAFPHPNKVLARKVYLDALFRTGTAEAAKTILKQLNKMDKKEKVIALLSLRMVQTVDKDMLHQATTLLTGNAAKEVYLAVGHIASKYCQQNGCEQSDIEPVSKKFTDIIKHCKANTKKDEDRIVYILKGIRNMQHLASSVSPILAECANIGHSNRIRVAALQAFSAASCELTLQNKALELLRDRNEDSELRIEAYLAAIDCPNAEMANQIADIVNSETVHQVGGFVASNLQAIRDSTDIARENQRHFFSNIRVTKHFPKDFKRYSFNNELSYKLDALGVSASADYKLIYSQQGFLPRSARLNVSTEVFGTNFNVFEANVRQENIENLLEYFVGPKGVLNKDFDEIMKVIEVGGSNNVGGDRARRSIADDTAKLSNKYKTYGRKNPQDINLDLSLKLFGSEITFLSLGDNIPNSLDDIIKHFSFALDEVKKELSAFNKNFHMHTLFLDTDLVYPTGIGMPLEFSTQGFAANKLEFGVNVDVDAILEQNWQQSKYRFKIVPSVDINIHVQLGFNTYVLTTGLRVVSNLHSATGGDVHFEFVTDCNGFNMDIELPREKLELIELQLNAGFYVGEQDKPIKSISLHEAKKHKPEQTEMCFTQLEAIGFAFCFSSTITGADKAIATTQAVNEPWQVWRPFSLTLYVTNERKFNLKGCHIPETATGSQQWKIDFSTPDSKVSHDTSLIFELGTKTRVYGRISFKNPQYKFALETGLNNDNKEMVLYAQYEYDDEVKKNRIGFVKEGNEYRPIIEIQDKNGVVGEINGIRADGKVIVEEKGERQASYHFKNFQIMNAAGENIVINGHADVGPAFLNSVLRVLVGKQTYIIKSNLDVQNSEYVAGLFINDEQFSDQVIGGSVKAKLGQQDYDLEIVGNINSWQMDIANALQYSKSESDSSVITSSAFKNEVTLSHKKNKVGSFKLQGSTEGEHKFEIAVEAARGKKLATVTVKFSDNQKNELDYVLEVNSKLNKHFMDLVSKCEYNGNHFVIDNVVSSSWGTSISAMGELGQRYTLQDIFIDLQGSVQFNGKDKPAHWILKVIGTPEKTNSELKVTRENGELVKYTGETHHPMDKITSGKVHLIIKNVIIVNSDFKLAKNGKGEITAHIETQKTDPKQTIEINSKFHVQAPKYDIELTTIIDAEKKLSFKTENVFDKLKVSSKNVAEILDKKISLDFNGLVKGEWRWNGELQGNFILTCPDGHSIGGSVNRKVTTNPKTGIAQGNMDLQYNEQLPNSGKKRSLGVIAKIEKYNLKGKELAVETLVVYTNYEGQKLEASYHVKHLLKGTNALLDVIIAVGGELLKKPTEITFVVDEYNSKHAIYRISGKYGGNLSANMNGNYNLGERGTPASYEVQGNLHMPESSFKTFEISSHGKFSKPATEAGGAYVVELHIDEKTGNDQFIKLNTMWKGAGQQGSYNLALDTKRMQSPLKLEGSYQRDTTTGSTNAETASGKQKYDFKFDYAEKYVQTSADVSYVGGDMANIHYTLDTSFESIKDIDVVVHAQKLEGSSYAITSQAKQNGKAYKIDAKLYGSMHKKGVDLQATLPGAEPIVIIGILEYLGERKAKFILQVDHFGDLDFKGSAEASYKSVENFYILAQWNSVKLHLDNFELEVRSEGTTMTSSLKNAQGNFLSGSATYALKREKNKSIIEGQGQLQYKEKTQNLNFRLIYQKYDVNIDKEIGFSYTFNGNFGPKNGVSTLKVTNKDFNVKLSVCEEKKQCTNIQVQSIANIDTPADDSSQHSFLILIDLRELGYPYEFELQSKTIRQNFKFQYSLDSSIISNNNLKYQLVANLQPTNSKLKLMLPNRELLLQTQQQYPSQGNVYGHYEQAILFYFDKTNKPNDVTRLTAIADVTGMESVAFNARGEIKFDHPTIRPLTVTGKVDANRQQRVIDAEVILDIFRLPEQKVIATHRIQNTENVHGFNITTNHALRSTGLSFTYEVNGHVGLNTERQEFSANAEAHCGSHDFSSSGYVFVNTERIEVLLNGLNEQIVQLVGEIDRNKHAYKYNSKIKILGQQPVEFVTKLEPTNARFTVKRQGLIDGSAEIVLGKEFKMNLNNVDKQVLNARVDLNADNFLQTAYTMNQDDMDSLLHLVQEEIKKDTEVTSENIRHRFQKLRQLIDRQVQLSKDSVPDLSQLKQSQLNNINDIIKELENDPALKEMAESVRKLYTKFVNIAGDISKITAESYENLHKSFIALYEKLEVILKDTIIPIWEESMVTSAKLIGELRIQIINLYTKAYESLITVLEKYGPILRTYGKSINDALKPFNEAAQDIFKFFIHAAEELITELKEYISKLPTFDAIHAEFNGKLQKLQLVEKVLEFVNELFDQLHILPQTPETIEFLQKIHEYIVAKFKKEPINDEKLVPELFKLFIKAVRSIFEAVKLSSTANEADISANSFSTWYSSLPISMDAFSKIPALLSFRFSIFNYLLNEDFEHLLGKDIFKSWVFFENFELSGHIVEGNNIFTFDNQYISFPGSCKYILAQDTVDGNFSVVAHLNNGKLKSIILTDRDGNFIEASDGGVLKLNGNSVEYPQHSESMHAWRKFYTIWILSDYGVKVMCTTDLKVCHISVNGFYTSKMRGLLGNGNSEPYDDFLQIDGSIASNYANFGNGYGVGKCNAVAYEERDLQPHIAICNEIFGLDSTLAFGYLFIDVTPFRTACDQMVTLAVEKDKEATACTIATAYASALRLTQRYVLLPPRCLKCAGAVGQRELGQEFTVKIPNNKADLVFVVDIGVSPTVLKNLIAPAITEVRDTLKARGFTDVQIGVIAFNESQTYPALLTSDNGKINYQGNVADVMLNGPNSCCSNYITQLINDTNILSIFELIDRLIKSIAPQSDELAFGMALNYPFRAGAAKSIIGVRSNSIGYGNLFKFIRAHVTSATTKFDASLLHMIAPVANMSLEGVPSEKLVGFNSRLVATLDGKDAKKRQKLQYKNDMGIDFVLDNGGWVFSTQHFDNWNSQDQKKALNQITNSIADTLFKTEIFSDCKCYPVYGIHGQHKCINKSSTFVPNKKVKTA